MARLMSLPQEVHSMIAKDVLTLGCSDCAYSADTILALSGTSEYWKAVSRAVVVRAHAREVEQGHSPYVKAYLSSLRISIDLCFPIDA